MLIAGSIYFYFSMSRNPLCNYEFSELGKCDNRVIIMSGNNDKDSFIGQHMSLEVPEHISGDKFRQKESWLIHEKYGDIRLLNEEKIDCPGKITVIGKLEMARPCEVTDIAKVCDSAPSIIVYQWSCD